MLETEDVDDDYFTPVASASLANIFGRSSGIQEKSENETLKYTPPRPQSANKQPEDSKATSCVFACALLAYEWHNIAYLQKGKVGFAIIKVIRTGTHNMILYDSNKAALSNLSLTNISKVTVKSNNLISYYDDKRKYWTLYGTQNEIKTISDLLKSLDVTIDTSTETDINPPEPVTNKDVQSLQDDSTKQLESDTDSSVHRKTKASILNRMANMGQSVLPHSTVPVEKTSDSSDTNDTDHHIKAFRHKPVKGMIKKNNIEKTLVDHQKATEIHTSAETPKHITNISAFTSDQLVPLINTRIVSNPSGNDMNAFITEQRISNTELRINMGRMSDKMDHIVTKINQLELKNQNEGTTEINTEILHKLLREYETKIKNYEGLFRKMEKDTSPQSVGTSNNQTIFRSEEVLKNTIQKQERTIKEQIEAVTNLQNEIKVLREAKDKQINVLQMNISELEAELNLKQTQLKDLTESNVNLGNINCNTNVEDKIKALMNDTYQAVATNFENGETYSGETTKKIIAMVIKKVTINALSDP